MFKDIQKPFDDNCPSNGSRGHGMFYKLPTKSTGHGMFYKGHKGEATYVSVVTDDNDCIVLTRRVQVLARQMIRHSFYKMSTTTL